MWVCLHSAMKHLIRISGSVRENNCCNKYFTSPFTWTVHITQVFQGLICLNGWYVHSYINILGKIDMLTINIKFAWGKNSLDHQGQCDLEGNTAECLNVDKSSQVVASELVKQKQSNETKKTITLMCEKIITAPRSTCRFSGALNHFSP